MGNAGPSYGGQREDSARHALFLLSLPRPAVPGFGLRNLRLANKRPGGREFRALFLLFPQGSSLLHSLFTSREQFPVATPSALPHSSNNANVRCLAGPAGDRGRAGGTRRFSRVNSRGVARARFGAFPAPGRRGLLITSSSQSGTEPPASAIAAGLAPGITNPANERPGRMRTTLTSTAARMAGPGRIFFWGAFSN